MKHVLVILAILALQGIAAGCAGAYRIGVGAGRVICEGLGCPCSGPSPAARRAMQWDVHRDGTVTPVLP